MPLVISSKGNDFGTWRPAGDFGAMFRDTLLERTATMTSEQAETLFRDVGSELELRTAEHDAALAGIRRLAEEAATAGEPAHLEAIMNGFYSACYAFFGRNRSATAFYRLSAEFLGALSGTAVALARRKVGLLGRRVPPLALIALGPTGRREFSPYCKLQLLLLHDDVDPSSSGPMGLLGRALHEVFEAAGLQLDEMVTPGNPDWRGAPAKWRQRLATGLERGEADEMIVLLRLADQSVLHDEGDLGAAFRHDCLERLAESRGAVQSLVTRLKGFSRGLGLMGGLRLERSGPCRGLFRLLDHALLPLSGAVSALSLMCGVNVGETPGRIRGLLEKGCLNVETAERLLEAWHLFNELRLSLEAVKQPEWSSQDALCLDALALSEAEQDQIRRGLEAVAVLQRHVSITFSGWEERTA